MTSKKQLDKSLKYHKPNLFNKPHKPEIECGVGACQDFPHNDYHLAGCQVLHTFNRELQIIHQLLDIKSSMMYGRCHSVSEQEINYRCALSIK